MIFSSFFFCWRKKPPEHTAYTVSVKTHTFLGLQKAGSFTFPLTQQFSNTTLEFLVFIVFPSSSSISCLLPPPPNFLNLGLYNSLSFCILFCTLLLWLHKLICLWNCPESACPTIIKCFSTTSTNSVYVLRISLNSPSVRLSCLLQRLKQLYYYEQIHHYL